MIIPLFVIPRAAQRRRDKGGGGVPAAQQDPALAAETGQHGGTGDRAGAVRAGAGRTALLPGGDN